MNINKLLECANKIANVEKYSKRNFSLGYLLDCVYFLNRIKEMPILRKNEYKYFLYQYYINKDEAAYSAVKFEEILAVMVSEDLVSLKYEYHLKDSMKYNADYTLAVTYFNLALN